MECTQPLYERYIVTPRITLPVACLGTHKMPLENMKEAVMGKFRLIDTAKSYGNEHEIRLAFGESQSLKIITKLFDRNVRSRLEMRQAVRDSTARLGRIPDLVLLHAPYPQVNLRAIFEEFDRMKKEKVIGDFGVSNFDLEQLDHLVNIMQVTPPAVNQVEYHPYYQRKELLEFCKNNNIVLQAYRPLAKGHLVKDPLMGELAKKYHCTPATLAYTWAAQQGMAIVSKTSSENHQDEFLNSGQFVISEVDMLLINNLQRPQALGRTCTSLEWATPFTADVRATWARL